LVNDFVFTVLADSVLWQRGFGSRRSIWHLYKTMLQQFQVFLLHTWPNVETQASSTTETQPEL